MMQYTLRELCVHVGVSRRTIQGYEKVGLMKYTDKNKYGHLLYDEEMLCRAKEIRFFQELGLKLREIKIIIDAPTEKKRNALLKRVEELEKEVIRLEHKIVKTNEYIQNMNL